MNVRQLFTDDEAVSPVIGVILMVAITVILAAVIGTFVLGLGDQVQSTAPQASFNFDYTDGADGTTVDTLEITHDGGDSIKAQQLYVASSKNFDTDSTTGNSKAPFTEESNLASGDDVSAGTTIEVDSSSAAAADDFSGATIRVTWEGESGDSTATLGKWSGPDA